MNGKKRLSVSAVMSMPRLCFTDNIFCAYDVFKRLGINLYRLSDVFWEQSLTRVINERVDAGDDYIVVLDYDSLFTVQQLDELFQLIEKNDLDAICPVQIKRNSNSMMVTPHPNETLDLTQPYSRILTGHFGLTILRADCLRKMPHPWFWSTPNSDGLWQDGLNRIDADNWFWVEFDRFGFKAYQANHVRIGHMQLMATWPTDGEPIHKSVIDFQLNGIPPESIRSSERSGTVAVTGYTVPQSPGVPEAGLLCV